MPAARTDVYVIGCGIPDISIGYTHLEQLLDEPRLAPRVRVLAVVEPFFLDPANERLSVESGFAVVAERLARERGVLVVRTIAELPPRADAESRPCLAIFASRTADAPRLFADLVDAQLRLRVTHALIEKPASPDAAGVAQVAAAAAAARIVVFVGYNKNVAPHAEGAYRALLELHARGREASIELYHDNDYATDGLAECFARCSVGMLKDMACHELALAVCLFGLRARDLLGPDGRATIALDAARSSLETHGGLTDWRALSFAVSLAPAHAGTAIADEPAAAVRRITLVQNRCGGDTSRIAVRALGARRNGSGVSVGDAPPSEPDERVIECTMPSEGARAAIERRRAARPRLRAYLAVQWDDYVELKERILAHVEAGAVGGQALARAPATGALGSPSAAGAVVGAAAGGAPPWPMGVASLQDALEVLQLAESLEPQLRRAWHERPGAS